MVFDLRLRNRFSSSSKNYVYVWAGKCNQWIIFMPMTKNGKSIKPLAQHSTIHYDENLNVVLPYVPFNIHWPALWAYVMTGYWPYKVAHIAWATWKVWSSFDALSPFAALQISIQFVWNAHTQHLCLAYHADDMIWSVMFY